MRVTAIGGPECVAKVRQRVATLNQVGARSRPYLYDTFVSSLFYISLYMPNGASLLICLEIFAIGKSITSGLVCNVVHGEYKNLALKFIFLGDRGLQL
jgi:hypothetical protein